MFRRCGKWSVVFALVCTIGGHWAFLQSVAWVGMVVSYCETDDVATALVKTFDGKNPCKLCKFVSEGQESEQNAQDELSLKKFDVFALKTTSFYFPPLIQTFGHTKTFIVPIAETPPTPPPLLS